MNSFKKISLFFMFMCISQLISIEIIQASNGNRNRTTQQHDNKLKNRKSGDYRRNKTNQRHAGNKRNRTNNQQPSGIALANQHYKNNNSQVNNPAAAVAVGGSYKNNQQQQENLQNFLNYCINNPTDSICPNQTPAAA